MTTIYDAERRDISIALGGGRHDYPTDAGPSRNPVS